MSSLFRKIESVRDELIDVCNNAGKTLHWRNVDSGSFMLVTLFRNNYDPRAMQVSRAYTIAPLIISYLYFRVNAILTLTRPGVSSNL